MNDSNEKVRQRITPINRSAELLPWRRAHELTRCFLYWLPVSAFPISTRQRAWAMEFLGRWIALMKERGLRPELFLQYKTVYPDLMKPLLNNMMEIIPVMGLGRKPGAPLPVFPSQKDVARKTQEMFDTLKRGDPVQLPDTKEYMPDYSYWFLDKSEKQQRELFFGYGGMTFTFLKPDPKTAPPPMLISEAQKKKMPILQRVDVDKMWAQANSMADQFLPKSKEFFGTGLENEPQMKGIPFILPLLDSADYFSQPPEVVQKAFELFDVYVRESPADKGLLLAFSTDMEEDLIKLLKQMKEEKLVYPES
jgi:hypothetical protein